MQLYRHGCFSNSSISNLVLLSVHSIILIITNNLKQLLYTTIYTFYIFTTHTPQTINININKNWPITVQHFRQEVAGNRGVSIAKKTLPQLAMTDGQYYGARKLRHNIAAIYCCVCHRP